MSGVWPTRYKYVPRELQARWIRFNTPSTRPAHVSSTSYTLRARFDFNRMLVRASVERARNVCQALVFYLRFNQAVSSVRIRITFSLTLSLTLSLSLSLSLSLNPFCLFFHLLTPFPFSDTLPASSLVHFLSLIAFDIKVNVRIIKTVVEITKTAQFSAINYATRKKKVQIGNDQEMGQS